MLLLKKKTTVGFFGCIQEVSTKAKIFFHDRLSHRCCSVLAPLSTA